MARIGVYVCHCGTNIAGTVDVAAVRDFAAALPGVVVARDYQYMCSDPGQDLIRKDIAEVGLDRVVVASCSPRMHEPTFRRALESAHLNGYLLEMANIREHCSWVTTDMAAATRKAKALVAGAVRRVALHEPLEERYADVTPQALVVGGGIAGIEAALKIADGGFRVHLVEKEASIGGQMAKLDKTFPTLDCSACILTPKMVAVAQHPNIVLHTYSEVEKVDGFVGNFRVTIRHKARSVDMQKCTGCGTCWSKCPYTAPNEFDEGLGKRKLIYVPFPQAVPNKPVIDRERCVKFQSGKCGACQKLCPTGAVDFGQQDELVEENVGAIIVATGYTLFDPSPGPWGYGRYPNVLTALQFERTINASGPTGGHVQLADGGAPRTVAILHCIGSRDQNYHEYCSNVCCMYSLKLAHLVKEKTGAEVYNFYIDVRAFGKAYEEFYNRVQNEGVYFIRGKGAEVTGKGGRLVVHCEDTMLGKYREIPVDMVILSPAMEARPDAARISQVFGIQRSADGFFLEAHAKLEPLKTATDGVFIAGACQGPKDIPYSVAQGAGAAAEVLRLLSAGRVTISPVVAQVAEEICSGCRACLPICPYNATSYDEEARVVRVNEALCKGCGTCVAACPSGALSVSHFRTPQVLAQIEEVLSV